MDSEIESSSKKADIRKSADTKKNVGIKKASDTKGTKIKSKKKTQLSLEEAFQKLDEVIKGLEDKEVSLENSFKLYHEGMELLKNCNTFIDKVEKQLIILEEEGLDSD